MTTYTHSLTVFGAKQEPKQVILDQNQKIRKVTAAQGPGETKKFNLTPTAPQMTPSGAVTRNYGPNRPRNDSHTLTHCFWSQKEPKRSFWTKIRKVTAAQWPGENRKFQFDPNSTSNNPIRGRDLKIGAKYAQE